MKKQALCPALSLGGLLALAWVGVAQGQGSADPGALGADGGQVASLPGGQQVMARVEGQAEDAGLSIPKALAYCLTNWRTLPEQVMSVGRQIWDQNAPALLVLIGGHGVGKTSSNGIPGSPGVGGGKIDDPGTKKPPHPGGDYPEPTTLVLSLVGVGCATMSLFRRRRQQKDA